ncbi:MAG: hypothetical protein HYX53_01085 [Chloroflexi bacterium]|nr:hypothetical protein [Chloroflexota bacterium]
MKISAGRTVLSAVLAITIGLLWTSAAQAQSPEGRVLDQARYVYAFGSNEDITITAQLPARCAGADATIGFFANGGAARVNGLDASLGSSQIKVPSNGLASGSVRVPISGSLKTVWPGVTSTCLANPVVSVGRPVLFGVRDESANPGGAASFVIPVFSLNAGGTVQVARGTLTVLVDDTVCGSVDLEDKANKDNDGNVWIRVGRADQPKTCNKPGATVSFRYPNGDVFFETREYVPGVTQPLENLAPAAGAHTGSGADPAAPAAGSGALTTPQQRAPGNPGAEGLRLGIGAFFIVLAGLLVTARRLRRRSAMQPPNR